MLYGDLKVSVCPSPFIRALTRCCPITHTHTHFKRSDDAQDAHGPSKQTLLDNFIRTSQSLYPQISFALLWATHILLPALRVQLLPCVCWLLDLGWRSGAHADCCHLTHSYQWSRRSWRRVPGVRGENRPTRGERTVRKRLMAKNRTPACSRVFKTQLDLGEIVRCQTKRCTEECGKLFSCVLNVEVDRFEVFSLPWKCLSCNRVRVRGRVQMWASIISQAAQNRYVCVSACALACLLLDTIRL